MPDFREVPDLAFEHRLALELGKTRREIREMSQLEFTDWKAFFRLRDEALRRAHEEH
jgi:hypothetical protein